MSNQNDKQVEKLNEKQILLKKKRMALLKKRRQICEKKFQSEDAAASSVSNETFVPKAPTLIPVVVRHGIDGLSISSSCDYVMCGVAGVGSGYGGGKL